MDDLKIKREIIKDDWGEPAKDFPTIKSFISLDLKYSEWMNSKTYLGWMRHSPFIENFEVGLLIRLH